MLNIKIRNLGLTYLPSLMAFGGGSAFLGAISPADGTIEWGLALVFIGLTSVGLVLSGVANARLNSQLRWCEKEI